MNEFILKFTINELQVIDKALGNMPYREVAPVIANINKQIDDARKNATKVNTEE